MMDIQVNLGEIVDDERICCGGKRGCRKKKCCPMMIIGVVLSEIIGLLSLIVMNILFAINGYRAFLGLPVGDEMISFVRKSFLDLFADRNPVPAQVLQRSGLVSPNEVAPQLVKEVLHPLLPHRPNFQHFDHGHLS